MLREVFEFALWLSVSVLILTISLIEAVFGKKARILSWVIEKITLPVMAAFVSTPTMERIRNIFKPSIERGEHPGKLYSIPVYQRKDGTTLRIGHLVERNNPQVVCQGDGASEEEDMVRVQKVHVVNDILMSADMSNVTLSLNPVEGVNVIHVEEMLCDVEEVNSLPGKKVAATLAKKGIATVIKDIPTYPHHIQRTIRKHMLAASLRREVQKFLAGFSMAKTLSLGTLDWRHDPGILGLERSTDFSLDYHVEKFTSAASQLDILMGQGWDVRTISGTDGYRVVLTLELWVDLNFDIKVQIHGCLCSGSLDTTSYRSTCLKVYTSPESRAAVSRLVSARSVNNTRVTQDGSKGGISMAWDEFQPPSGETSPNRLPGIPSATNSLEDLIAGLADAGTSTGMAGLDSALARVPSSTAVGGLDDALARVNIRNNDLMFESPIKEESVNMSSVDGPNTSTPAECLDNSKEECEIFQATGSPVNSVKTELSNMSSQPDGRETPRTLNPDQITVAEVEQVTPIIDQEMGTSKAPEVDQNKAAKESEVKLDTDLPESNASHVGNNVQEENVVPVKCSILESDLNSSVDETGDATSSMKAEVSNVTPSDERKAPSALSPDLITVAEVEQTKQKLDQEKLTSAAPEGDQNMESGKVKEETEENLQKEEVVPIESNELETGGNPSLNEKKMERAKMGIGHDQDENENIGSKVLEANTNQAYVKHIYHETNTKLKNGDNLEVDEEGSKNIKDEEVGPIETDLTTSINEENSDTPISKIQQEILSMAAVNEDCQPNSNETEGKVTSNNEHDLKSSDVPEVSQKENELPESISSKKLPEKLTELESAIIKEQELDTNIGIDDSTKNANESFEEKISTTQNKEFVQNNPEVLFLSENANEEMHMSAPPSSETLLLPETPAKGSSSLRVHDYIKSLPPTSEIDDKEIMIDHTTTVDNMEIPISKAAVKKNDLKEILADKARLEDSKHDSSFISTDDSIDSTNVSFNADDSTDSKNVSLTPRKDDVSLPGSQASSRMTGLSSQLSGRIGSGMFYGMTPQTAQPTCPFPDEWQHSAIPESIENDDDLD